MNDNITLSDIAALMKNGDGNWETVLIILFLLICVGGGTWGNRAPMPQQGAGNDTLAASVIANGGPLTVGQFSDQSRLQEIQAGQSNIVNANNQSEQRLTAALSALQSGQAQNTLTLQQCCSDIQANCNANKTEILMSQKDETIQQLRDEGLRKDMRIQQLETQAATDKRFDAIEQRLSVMPTVPTTPTFNAGSYPFCQCNCQAA